MKKIVNALREWCGTVKTEDDKKGRNVKNNNRGDTEVFFVVSLGTVFLICICLFQFCLFGIIIYPYRVFINNAYNLS